MSAQSIFDHNAGCKAKHNKQCAEDEGPMKAPKRKRKSWGQKEVSQLNSPDVAKKS